MEYLFVGGPKHGETMRVADGRISVIVPLMPDFWSDYYRGYGETSMNIPTIRTVEYFRTDVGSDRIIYVAKRTSN